jgi:hypothetical protein
MAEIINLNKARKAKGRAGKAQKAVENRIAFGRTKAQKLADAEERARAEKLLDDVRLE